MLGYIDSFITTKDICVFASKAAEAENIGKLLTANCHFALVAHEFIDPQERANVRRQWNTPHTTDAMPVLGNTYSFLHTSVMDYYLLVFLPDP